MAEYISKDALVAEITRRLHFINNWIEGDKRRQMRTNGVSSAYYKTIGSKHACESILDFTNTLEAKEVDIEKELSDWRHEHFHGRRDDKYVAGEYLERTSQYELAKHFFELGLNMARQEESREENHFSNEIDTDRCWDDLNF